MRSDTRAHPQGHERGAALAARAKSLEQRLLQRVDPIDYSFLAPLLHTNRSKAYQRHSVMLGALVQVCVTITPLFVNDSTKGLLPV